MGRVRTEKKDKNTEKQAQTEEEEMLRQLKTKSQRQSETTRERDRARTERSLSVHQAEQEETGVEGKINYTLHDTDRSQHGYDVALKHLGFNPLVPLECKLHTF